jgi:hypothetical protein
MWTHRLQRIIQANPYLFLIITLACLWLMYPRPSTPKEIVVDEWNAASEEAHVKPLSMPIPYSASNIALLVMTSPKQFASMSTAIQTTWLATALQHDADTYIACEPFTSHTAIPQGMHFIPLKQLDASVSPLDTSHQLFDALQTVFKMNESAEWFVVLAESTFPVLDNLVSSLVHLDASQPLALGVPMPTALWHPLAMCSYAPGMILSNGLMKHLVPHLKECSDALPVGNADAQFAECLRYFVPANYQGCRGMDMRSTWTAFLHLNTNTAWENLMQRPDAMVLDDTSVMAGDLESAVMIGCGQVDDMQFMVNGVLTMWGRNERLQWIHQRYNKSS